MALSNRMKPYTAGDGYVYDWAEPHIATIIKEDGEKEFREEHLYVKYLFLGPFDDIKNYKLVKDPKAQVK